MDDNAVIIFSSSCKMTNTSKNWLLPWPPPTRWSTCQHSNQPHHLHHYLRTLLRFLFLAHPPASYLFFYISFPHLLTFHLHAYAECENKIILWSSPYCFSSLSSPHGDGLKGTGDHLNFFSHTTPPNMYISSPIKFMSLILYMISKYDLIHIQLKIIFLIIKN